MITLKNCSRYSEWLKSKWRKDVNFTLCINLPEKSVCVPMKLFWVKNDNKFVNEDIFWIFFPISIGLFSRYDYFDLKILSKCDGNNNFGKTIDYSLISLKIYFSNYCSLISFNIYSLYTFAAIWINEYHHHWTLYVYWNYSLSI